jgi:adenylate cyclase
MDPNDYQAAGLYDPDAENAAERLELLEFLAASGVTLEQMVEAEANGVLLMAAADQVVMPGERISLREMAHRAGISEEEAQVAWRVVGIGGPVEPDEPRFVDQDVPAFANFHLACELFGTEPILQWARLAGSFTARLAEAGWALFMSDLERPLAEARATEPELARAFVAGSVASAGVPGTLDTFYRHHWEATTRRFRAARAGVAGFDSIRLAVGFVDLVGFTPLAQALPTSEFNRRIADFEARAYDIATSREGRIVKLIGDEVMFTALDAPGACEIALTLFETLGEHGAVTPRSGLAIGELITRAGDYYGPVVNLASRAADQAVPDEILVSAELREETVKATDDYRFDPAGRRMLKGFDEPVEVFSLARA